MLRSTTRVGGVESVGASSEDCRSGSVACAETEILANTVDDRGCRADGRAIALWTIAVIGRVVFEDCHRLWRDAGA